MELKYLIETIIRNEQEVTAKKEELEALNNEFEAKKNENVLNTKEANTLDWPTFSCTYDMYCKYSEAKEELTTMMSNTKEQKEKLHNLMMMLNIDCFSYPMNGTDETKGRYVFKRVVKGDEKGIEIGME